MSALTVTFKSAMEGMARATCGEPAPVADEVKFILADALTSAMKTCWEKPAGKSWVWPWAVLTATITSLTSGAITFAELDYPRWFAVYSADPRGVASVGHFIPSYADGDGIHPMDNTLGSYFVFYIPRAPEYTSTLPVVATAYATDDLVYDDTSRVGGTGNCFRRKGANYTSAAGNTDLTAELADTAQWVVQPFYKNFQAAATLMAFAQYLETKRAFEASAQKDADGRYELSLQYVAVTKQARHGGNPYYNTGTWI